MKKIVAVAMSGGVDSSVAAALLKEQGCEVIGITMCLGASLCCGEAGIRDAKRVSDVLGIRHYVLDFSAVFKQAVADEFFSDYEKGRTPNPCVVCNEHIKFGALLEKAKGFGADFLATGHYARINGGLLARAKDTRKDQSYFLYRVVPKALKSVMFPLGELEKTEVRELAKKYKLPVSAKPDSQEVCFITEKDFSEGLAKRVKTQKGLIKDKSGKVLGEHKGIALYTVGQRQGLGVSSPNPLYVTRIDAKSNTIYVGAKEDAFSKSFKLQKVLYYGDPACGGAGLFDVKIRYLHKETPAAVILEGDYARVTFETPQFAVTPGQSAVFYEKGRVYGGGIIETTEV
jgi:tRNA-specific 2-thiouridylase